VGWACVQFKPRRREQAIRLLLVMLLLAQLAVSGKEQ
jgi:hypothetical protein